MPIYEFKVMGKETGSFSKKLLWAANHQRALEDLAVIWPSYRLLATTEVLEVPRAFWDGFISYNDAAQCWDGFEAYILGSAQEGWSLARYSLSKERMVIPNFPQNQCLPKALFYIERWGEFRALNHCSYQCDPFAQSRLFVPKLKVLSLH